MRIRILILALGTFAIGTDGFVIAGILPEIARGLKVPVSTAGFLITIFAWAYALGSPVLATMTGKLASRPGNWLDLAGSFSTPHWHQYRMQIPASESCL